MTDDEDERQRNVSGNKVNQSRGEEWKMKESNSEEPVRTEICPCLFCTVSNINDCLGAVQNEGAL